MKFFHETKIEFYSKRELKICVISDIHFSYQVTDAKLNALLDKLRERKPDYIFLPGDLIDSNDMIFKKSEEERLLKFLSQLGEISKTLISVGNHDFYKKASKEYKKRTGEKWEIFENREFVSKVRKLKNIYYLDNAVYKDSKIYVFGFTQKPEYYNVFDKAKKVSIFHPVDEDVEEMLRELDEVNPKLISRLPKARLKFALVHSPVYLNDSRVKAKLSEFDYFISGHMHNGVVPPVVDEFWLGTRGVVSPTRNMLPAGIRNTVKKSGDKSIVAGAVTTWHECTGAAHNLNALYPSYFMTIEFKKDRYLKGRPEVTKKYLNW